MDIDTEKAVVCGAHIALRHTTMALLDLRGRVLAQDRIPHRAPGDPGAVLRDIAAVLPGLAPAGGGRVLGLGVATGGWVDSEAGLIADHPLLGWRDVEARDLLESLTGLPVRVDGHARAMVRAEGLFGDRRARSSAVHLFAGNVVDAAFAVGGTVQHGPRSAAGAVAHLPVPGRADPCECGGSGCLQAVVSDAALASQATAAGLTTAGLTTGGLELAGSGPAGAAGPGPAAALLAAAQAGEPRALGLFWQRARALGAAAATLLSMLNPRVLIVAESGVLLLPGCLDVLRSEVLSRSPWNRSPWDGTPEQPVVASSFGREVLAVAAGTVLLAEIYADPVAI